MNKSRTRNRKNYTETTPAKSRKRVRNRGIVEGVFFPVLVKDCQEGTATEKKKPILCFELQHLETKAIFTTVVFENVAPHFIDAQIIDCILAEDVDDFDPEDLIGGGFMVKLKFKTKNDITYMNIVEVEPLDEKSEALRQRILQKEKQTKLASSQAINEMEDEMHETMQPKSKVMAGGDDSTFESDEEDDLDDDHDFTLGDNDCPFCDDLGCEACEDDEE